MTRSELVKFRITPKAKTALVLLADARHKSVSDLMRDQTELLMTGSTTDPQIRADLVTVRRLANVLLAYSDETGRSRIDATAIVDTAKKLRAIATRHLGQLS